MRKLALIIGITALFLFMIPVVGRKYSVPLISPGKIVATATRPLAWPWEENEFSVYVGRSKEFSLWGGIFNCPLFIYAFANDKKFLCIDNDDTAILVFVVDFANPHGKPLKSPEWPMDGYARNYMAQRHGDYGGGTIAELCGITRSVQ
jgi:hypothetical protein